MSWIDKLEQRVGLKPKDEPEETLTLEERKDVLAISGEAISVIGEMMGALPWMAEDEKLRELAQAVVDGHERLAVVIAEQDRAEQMKARSTDVG